jgi:hypothetical protein
VFPQLEELSVSCGACDQGKLQLSCFPWGLHLPNGQEEQEVEEEEDEGLCAA